MTGFNQNIWQQHLQPNVTQTQQNTPASIWDSPNLVQINSPKNNPNLVPQNYSNLQEQGTNFTNTLNQPADAGGSWLSNQLQDGGMLTREGMFGGESGGGGLNVLTGIGSNLVRGYTGLKQLKLGEDTLAFNKDVTRKNINTQAQLTNMSMNQRYNNTYSQASEAERANMLSPEEYATKNNIQGL